MPIILDGTQGITFPDNSRQYNGYFGFKNRIINGDMRIDQRNNGAAVTASTTSFSVDRFQVYSSQSSKYTAQRNAGSVTPPIGYTNYLGITVGASANVTVGAGDVFTILQNIEGFNVADLGFGAAGAQTVTLSFWVRSSLTGLFGGSLVNDGYNRGYPFSYTINAANTWEQKSITIAGDTTGTWATNNAAGIRLYLDIGSGSNYRATAGAWTAGSPTTATGTVSLITTNSATFYITGVQLEEGVVSTNFDYRPYGTELQLCQRYCYAIFASESSSDNYTRFGMGDCDLTTRVQTITWFPVSMRSIPSLTATAANTFTAYSAGNTFTLTAINVAPTITPKVGTTDGTTSGLTAGRAGQIIANNNRTAYLIYSAEL